MGQHTFAEGDGESAVYEGHGVRVVLHTPQLWAQQASAATVETLIPSGIGSPAMAAPRAGGPAAAAVVAGAAAAGASPVAMGAAASAVSTAGTTATSSTSSSGAGSEGGRGRAGDVGSRADAGGNPADAAAEAAGAALIGDSRSSRRQRKRSRAAAATSSVRFPTLKIAEKSGAVPQKGVANSEGGIPIDNDFFEGRALLLLKLPEDQDEANNPYRCDTAMCLSN